MVASSKQLIGEKYPISEGVICLLPESERGADLGDGKFYEENPFGLA